jgi:hypothetical protein
MQDPPAEEIIDDPEALDHFLRARRSKNEQEERKSRLQASKTSAGRKRERLM